MQSQRAELYEAEEAAGEMWCEDPPVDVARAQAIADDVLEWAKGRFGIRSDLSVVVEEFVTEATAAEHLENWESPYLDHAGQVKGPLWIDGAPTSLLNIHTAVATDNGFRTTPTEHLILHEMAHVVVGHWPGVVDGRWQPDPDSHGALFARRHVDILARFHPDCALELADAYEASGIEVAEPDVDPASWWNLPRPSKADIAAAIAAQERGGVG